MLENAIWDAFYVDVLRFGLAIFYQTEKTGVAKKRSFSRTFLIKCPGQIEAMGHGIISCVCKKMVLIGKLQSILDFGRGVPHFQFSFVF